MREEIKSIDIAKLLASIMVIALHTSPLSSISVIGDKAMIGICRIAVPLFFAMSGYLFFMNRDKDYVANLKKYCLRLLKYWIVYSILGIVVLKPPVGLNIIRTILLDGFGVTWFFHGLIVAMGLVVLLLHLGGEGEPKWFVYAIPIVLYMCGTMMNTYFSLLGAGTQQLLEQVYYPFFVTARNGFFSGTIYILIGYCVARDDSSDIKRIVLLTVLSFVFFFSELILTWNVTEKIHGRELFFTMPFLIICVLKLILALNVKCKYTSKRFCLFCRKLSFAFFGWQLLFIVTIPGTINSMLRFLIITALCTITGALLILLSRSKNNVARKVASLFI